MSCLVDFYKKQYDRDFWEFVCHTKTQKWYLDELSSRSGVTLDIIEKIGKIQAWDWKILSKSLKVTPSSIENNNIPWNWLNLSRTHVLHGIWF